MIRQQFWRGNAVLILIVAAQNGVVGPDAKPRLAAIIAVFGGQTVSCTVVEFSPCGARPALPRPSAFPDHSSCWCAEKPIAPRSSAAVRVT